MERGWSQGRLADKLNHAAGHPINTRHDVYRWESGKRLPRSWLPVLAEVFDLPPETLESARAVTVRGTAGSAPSRAMDVAALTVQDSSRSSIRHEDVWATLDLATSAPVDVDATHSLDLSQAETIIHAMCAQAVIEALGSANLARAVSEPPTAAVLSGVLRHGDRTLLLKIRPDLHSEQLLHIVIQDARELYLDSPAYEHHDIRLHHSVGLHATVRITLPNDLGQVAQRAIVDDVNRILDSGYGWLNDRLQQAMCQVTGTVERDCLQLFRQAFRRSGSVEFEREVWLVKTVKDRVTYAVDPEVTSRVLAAGRQYHSLQQAPAAIAVALLANSIPFARSFSRQAISARSTVPMSLSSTPYEEINKDFLLAQGAIYADQMLLSPLAGSDRHGWLLAAYPASASDSARAVLEGLRPVFGSYLSHSRHVMQDPVIRALSAEGDSSDDGA